MDQLQREELPGLDEPSIILVRKVQCEDGEEVGEHEVDREIGISVADKIEPVGSAGGVVRRWFEEAGRET